MDRVETGARAGEMVRAAPWRLLRLLLVNAAIGAAVAVGVVAGLVLTDAGGLGRLIRADHDPVVAVALLTFGFIITLGSAAMGAAIMGLPYDTDRPSAGRSAQAEPPTAEKALAVVSASR